MAIPYSNHFLIESDLHCKSSFFLVLLTWPIRVEVEAKYQIITIVYYISRLNNNSLLLKRGSVTLPGKIFPIGLDPGHSVIVSTNASYACASSGYK